MIDIQKKNIKINIIPLIDIIFLMLVFFMLATNFSEKKEISFKLKQKIETLNDDQENLLISDNQTNYYERHKKNYISKLIMNFITWG